MAEMLFVDVLPCWTLWPPALRTPSGMVIHPFGDTQAGLPPLTVPAPGAATSPYGTWFLFSAGMFVQPGLGNSAAEGHFFST